MSAILRDYWQTLTDPGHFLTELTWTLGDASIGLIVGRFWLRRHDQKVHGYDGKHFRP